MKTQMMNVPFSEDFKKKQELRYKKRKRRRRICKTILLIALLFGIWAFAVNVSFFNITTFKVSGNSKYKAETIVNASGIDPYSNGFKQLRADLKELVSLRIGNSEKKLVKTLPYLKSAIVRYIPPSTISIKVEERKPYACVETNGSLYIIDSELQVIDMVNSIPKGVINIKGFNPKRCEIGQALEDSNTDMIESIKTVINVIAQLDKEQKTNLSGRIKYFDVTNILNLDMNIDGKLNVKLGDTNDLEYKINFLNEILKKQQNISGTLDLSVENPILKTN